MKQNKLPKYWTVKCPDYSPDSEKFKKVIDYLNSINHGAWKGNITGYFYGHKYNNGTFCCYAPPAECTRLTIDEFIEALEDKEEFILPERWCVPGDRDGIVRMWFNENKQDCYDYSKLSDPDYLFCFPFVNKWKHLANKHTCHHSQKPGDYVKITLEQFKKYVLKENIMNNNETTQTITKLQLKEIWRVACASWKTKLENIAREDPFSDVVTFTNDQTEEMFHAADTPQTKVLELFLTRPVKDKNAFKKALKNDLDELSKKIFGNKLTFQILDSATPSERPELNLRAFYVHADYEVKIGKAEGGTYIEILKR